MNLRDSIAAARVDGPLPQPDGANVFEFRFGADDPVFAGHFPNRPLLPGIYQIEMARMAAEWVLRKPLFVRQVCKAKFLHPIAPDQTARLTLKLTEENDVVRVRVGFLVNNRPAGESLLELCRNAQ